MSTRSWIGVEGEDGVRAVWCATDGYLNWNGRLLLECYNSLESAERLLELGSLYHLDREIGDRVVYASDYTELREAGLTWTISGTNSLRVFSSRREMEEEYVYIFRHGMWWVFEGDGWLYARPLHEVLYDCRRYGVRGFAI